MLSREEMEFFSIVPEKFEETKELADTEDIINGNNVENSPEKRTFLEKAREGLAKVRSHPWSEPASDILKITGDRQE